MKIPTNIDAEKCIEVRCRSKKGERVLQDEHEFCRNMYIQYPAWYKRTEATIFNRTIPFGSQQAKKKEWKPRKKQEGK